MLEQLVTARETWRDQLDIARLLNTPRRTRRDRIYSVNDKYGFGRSLKLYAKMPETAPIFGIVPHAAAIYGCLGEKPEAPKQELIAKIPCIFTSNERCFDAFWNAGKRHLFPIGLSPESAKYLLKLTVGAPFVNVSSYVKYLKSPES